VCNNIPEFDEIYICLPSTSNGVSVGYNYHEIYYEGPDAWKGVLQVREREMDPETCIIILQYDRYYSPRLVKELLKASKEFPDAIIGFSGYILNDNTMRRVRHISLQNSPVEVSWLQSTHGILLKSGFFPENFWWDILQFREDPKYESIWYTSNNDIPLAMYFNLRNVPQLVISSKNPRISKVAKIRGIQGINNNDINYQSLLSFPEFYQDLVALRQKKVKKVQAKYHECPIWNFILQCFHFELYSK
jgi:hypothetical protein